MLFILHPFLLGFHCGHHCFLCQWTNSVLDWSGISSQECLPKLSGKFPSASSAMFASSPSTEAPSSLSHCYVHLQNETFPLPTHARRINRSVWAVWCRREHLKNWNPFLPFLCHPCHQQKHTDTRSFISNVLINGTSGINDKFYLKENSPELKYLNIFISLLKLYLIELKCSCIRNVLLTVSSVCSVSAEAVAEQLLARSSERAAVSSAMSLPVTLMLM